MANSLAKTMQFARLTLRISDPATSIAFYVDLLGMTLLSTGESEGCQHFSLGYPDDENDAADFDQLGWQSCCVLELLFFTDSIGSATEQQPAAQQGYWKIALALPELDIAREKLLANGVAVDEPRQVGDIAYLCHFDDPDGYCIELIQHDFLQNHTRGKDDPQYPLGSKTVFSLITLRVKDADASLRFYTEQLGMRLVSVQPVTSRGFTLYFLSLNDESPPYEDLAHVQNREWLWRRPYTLLELQHVWGTEEQPDFAYDVSAATGFLRVGLGIESLQQLDLPTNDTGSDASANRSVVLWDPDGYAIEVAEKNT